MHALIVDDDADIREVARLSLELIAGWVVTEADSGAAAVERARADRPDVILLDVMMPGLDGVATLRLLNLDRSTHDIPVIFLTAKAQIGERRHLEDAGARGLIPKPFDPLRLSAEIETILSIENDPAA
jgi:two-component system, OmpR family, alkaline phosphatase synthesis response regulator PhoP